MEAIAATPVHIKATEKMTSAGDTLNITHDDEFDFEIGGPENDLEVLGMLASTTDGSMHSQNHRQGNHHIDNEAVDDADTQLVASQGTSDHVDEVYGVEFLDQEHYHRDPDALAIEATADTHFDQHVEVDALHGQCEGVVSHGPDDAPYGESENAQEPKFGESSGELGYVDVDPHDGVPAQGTTAASFEYAQIGPDTYEDGVWNEDNNAQEAGETAPRTEARPSSRDAVTSAHIEDEIVFEDKIFEVESSYDGIDMAQSTTTNHERFENADEHVVQVCKRSDELPRVRVSYRTAEFYLFASSAEADPDEYFFENATVLDCPLSQFLQHLRQVISNDLQTCDELFVRVDGLGLEFGESTTEQFLEHTTFGRVLELYEQLVKFDGENCDSSELYVYLETRRNCLHRLEELTNNVDEGRGLSQIAIYYEASPDFEATEGVSNENEDEGHQDTDSDDVSCDEPREEAEKDLATSQRIAQRHIYLQLDENQCPLSESSHPNTLEAVTINESPLLNADKDHHGQDEDIHSEPVPVETQADVEFVTRPDFGEVDAEEAEQNTHLSSEDDGQLVTDGVEAAMGTQSYTDDTSSRKDVEETEANIDIGDEILQEGHTDDYTAAENDDYLEIDATEEEPFETAQPTRFLGPNSSNNSASANLDEEDTRGAENAPTTQILATGGHLVQIQSQLEPDGPQAQVDEIHWNDDDNEIDDLGGKMEQASQRQTSLSPSSFSSKRDRQADEDDIGLGDDGSAKRRRT